MPRMSHRLLLAAALCLLPLAPLPADPPRDRTRRVAPNETWTIRDGRFIRNGRWAFLKTGKLLSPFEDPATADRVIRNIDLLVDRHHYANFSLNIYPDQFDRDADGRVDDVRRAAYDGIGRILDHCWERGVFASLSFETYNVGGGGTPAALFERHTDLAAVNALGEPARDVEYGNPTKLIPSIFHPAYLKWSRDFIREFLRGLGPERGQRLLYVETTVEPQYLGRCGHGDKDQRRAALDFGQHARAAFEAWAAALPAADPRRGGFRWPATQEERDRAIGNAVFNAFRGEALGRWISGDIAAVREVVPAVYIAVDYNGRFDDPRLIRTGDRDAMLAAIVGADILQVAPHPPVWTDLSWEDVRRANARHKKGWAISEHMTANGGFPADDAEMTAILDNTLARGTRWGWEFVDVDNHFPDDIFDMYTKDWTSSVLDVIEGPNWEKWVKKIGAPRFVPERRK